MNFARLSAWILSSESAGELRAGEGVVLGRHEPSPLPGAVVVGQVDETGMWVVERVDGDGAAAVVRRYDTEAGAGAYAFRTLGDVVAERHWGEGWAAANAERVRRGSLLRTAALLSAAGWDVLWDRHDLVDLLTAVLGPARPYYIEGVGDTRRFDMDGGTLAMVRDGTGWAVGGAERGRLVGKVHFAAEGDACRWMAIQAIGGQVASMGSGPDRPPHIVDQYRAKVAAALAEATALVT